MAAAGKKTQSAVFQDARARMMAGDFAAVLALTEPFPPAMAIPPIAAIRVRALTALGFGVDALKFFDACDSARPPTPAMLEAAAEAAGAVDDWERALAFLDRAVADSNEPRLHFRRGQALFALERFDDCLEAMARVARAAEFRARALTVMIRAYLRQRDSQELMDACQALLDDEPDNLFALDHLVRQSITLRDFEQARAWFARANTVDAERFPWALYDFLSLERDGRLVEAVRLFSDLGDGSPDEMRRRVVVLLQDMGRYDEAAALAPSSDDPEFTAATLASINLAAGRPQEATQIGIPPADRPGQLVAAVAAYAENQLDQAAMILDRIPSRPGDRLSIGNFRDLVRTGRRLSHRLFTPATETPRGAATLPVVQQLWVGSDLSQVERLSIRSFLACGHAVHLYSYETDIAVPPGCVLRDAREIMPAEDIFVHSARTGRNQGSFAGFADLFRWKLIHERGGAWADCDVICLAALDADAMVSTELLRLGALVMPAITNCYFAAAAGEPAFLRAYEIARRARTDELQWGEAGIHLMARIVAEEGWGERLTAPTDICPIPPYRIVDAMAGRLNIADIVTATGCRAVHLYNEILRDVGFDKTAPFAQGGLLEFLDRRVTAKEQGAS